MGSTTFSKLGMILENKVVQKVRIFFTVNGLLSWYSFIIFFWKNSIDFRHRKLTLKVQIRHFLTNHNSWHDCFKTISIQQVDSWAEILDFRTHHLYNSTTELTLLYNGWGIYEVKTSLCEWYNVCTVEWPRLWRITDLSLMVNK